MTRHTPRSTLTDTLLPYTCLFRSLEHPGDSGGKIEFGAVSERCRGGCAERFACDKARQKDRAAGRKTPDDDLQTGPGHQRILRRGRLDTTDRTLAPV